MNIRDAIAAAKRGEKIKRAAYGTVIGYDGMEFRFWDPDIKKYSFRKVFTHEDQEANDWHVYEELRPSRRRERTPEEIESYVKERGRQIRQELEAAKQQSYEDETESECAELLRKALARIEMLETENKYLKDKIKKIGTMIEIVKSAVNK